MSRVYVSTRATQLFGCFSRAYPSSTPRGFAAPDPATSCITFLFYDPSKGTPARLFVPGITQGASSVTRAYFASTQTHINSHTCVQNCVTFHHFPRNVNKVLKDDNHKWSNDILTLILYRSFTTAWSKKKEKKGEGVRAFFTDHFIFLNSHATMCGGTSGHER